MRSLICLLVALSVGVGAAAAALALAPGALAAAPAWKPDNASAKRWAATRAGQVSWSVRTGKRAWRHDAYRSAPGASLIKAMLLTAYLRQPSVRSRALSLRERRLLSPMIRRSDNLTATTVRNRLGVGALARFARRARMRSFSEHGVWGLSRVTAADQSRFFLALPQLLPARHRAYGLKLLASVVPRQRWGVGKAAPRGWKLYFKGGWGSGTGAVNHQSVLLVRGSHKVALSVLTTNSPSHAYASRTLQGVFSRLLRKLERSSSSSSSS